MQVPVQAPVSEAPDTGLAADENVPRHRTAAPGKGALKVTGGRQHTAQTLLPDNATAQQKVAAAFEKEASVSEPFAADGRYSGKYDATMLGSKRVQKIGVDDRPNLGVGATLFGNPTKAKNVPGDASAAVDAYAASIEATSKAETRGQQAAAQQVLADQGSAKANFPDFTKSGYEAFRTPFYNGYWLDGEARNAKPTASAKTDKRVRFDDTAEQVPVEQRDPNRIFAQKNAEAKAQKAKRRAFIEDDLARVQSAAPDAWNQARMAGARTHEIESPKPSVAIPPPVRRELPADPPPIPEEVEAESLLTEEDNDSLAGEGSDDFVEPEAAESAAQPGIGGQAPPSLLEPEAPTKMENYDPLEELMNKQWDYYGMPQSKRRGRQ
jgi:hypothetical protein